MNIRHLKIFQKVCETMSITKAANQLYMTQPAISHAIHELEDELGFFLFERISRRIYLTQPGILFYEKTQTILNLFDDIEQRKTQFLKEAPIRVGSSITLASHFLPKISNQFHLFYPETILKVTVNNAKMITQMLLQNEIDLAFIEGIVKENCFVKLALPSYSIAIVSSPSYFSLNRSSNITIDEFIKENLLLREKGSAIRDTLDSALLLHDKIAEPIWVSANSQVLLNAALSGLGIAVVPAALAKSKIEKKELISITVENLSLHYPNYLVYRKEKYLSDPLKQFITFVMDNKR